MSNLTQTLSFVLFWAGYVVIFLTQYIYEQPLFEWSGREIPILQKNASELEWSVWNFYTHIGSGTTQIVYFIVFLIFFSSKNETLVLAVNLALEMYFMTLLKTFHF